MFKFVKTLSDHFGVEFNKLGAPCRKGFDSQEIDGDICHVLQVLTNNGVKEGKYIRQDVDLETGRVHHVTETESELAVNDFLHDVVFDQCIRADKVTVPELKEVVIGRLGNGRTKGMRLVDTVQSGYYVSKVKVTDIWEDAEGFHYITECV